MFKKMLNSVSVLLLFSMLCGCGESDMPVNDVPITENEKETEVVGTDNYNSYEEEKDISEYLYYDKVKEMLDKTTFVKTGKPAFLYNDAKYSSGNTVSNKENSISFILAETCKEMEANPVSVFNSVLKTGIYDKKESGGEGVEFSFDGAENYGGKYLLNSTFINVSPKNYVHNEAGCREFVNDLMILSDINPGTLGIDYEFKYADRNGDCIPEVHYSPEDGCYYTYFISYSDAVANILVMYMKTYDGENLTDVEFQMLNGIYMEGGAAGCGIHFDYVRESIDGQIVSFMACTEQLLTGTTYFEGEEFENLSGKNITVPNSYSVEDYNASVNRVEYSSGTSAYHDEIIDILTYRISKA